MTNLDVKVADYPHFYVNIKEAGLYVGSMKNDNRVLHTGWLMNIGYFSLIGNTTDFGVFNTTQSITRVSGLVLSPQVFAVMNITGWLKLRTGLTYCVFSFEDQTMVRKSDLNNVSLSFGFIIGRFK